jgi:hypothetical protein
LDAAAKSAAADIPPFIARPPGAPVYYGFPLVPETMTDGWFFGAITEFIEAEPCQNGDAFVVAPDDARAGLVWDVGSGTISEISPPERGRWGVYQVWFPNPVKTVSDLVQNFRSALPQLKKKYDKVCAGGWKLG